MKKPEIRLSQRKQISDEIDLCSDSSSDDDQTLYDVGTQMEKIIEKLNKSDYTFDEEGTDGHCEDNIKCDHDPRLPVEGCCFKPHDDSESRKVKLKERPNSKFTKFKQKVAKTKSDTEKSSSVKHNKVITSTSGIIDTKFFYSNSDSNFIGNQVRQSFKITQKPVKVQDTIDSNCGTDETDQINTSGMIVSVFPESDIESDIENNNDKSLPCSSQAKSFHPESKDIDTEEDAKRNESESSEEDQEEVQSTKRKRSDSPVFSHKKQNIGDIELHDKNFKVNPFNPNIPDIMDTDSQDNTSDSGSEIFGLDSETVKSQRSQQKDCTMFNIPFVDTPVKTRMNLKSLIRKSILQEQTKRNDSSDCKSLDEYNGGNDAENNCDNEEPEWEGADLNWQLYDSPNQMEDEIVMEPELPQVRSVCS